ncbi:MAG: hypothetical protein E7631_13250 [Ruminococcaceae bacterium]|nr:hypothetical protein [Oscillospiraceae bacterium]
MKKTITWICLFACLLMTACQEKEADLPADTADTAETAGTETVPETEHSYVDALPKADYTGASFRSYGANTLNGMEYATLLQFSWGEQNGESCNDILYDRTAYLEEFYNVDFVETIEPGNVSASKVQANIKAGDAAHDMIYGDVASFGYSMVLAGGVYPSDMIPGLQLDNPYWSSEMRESLTIGGSYYFPTGAITPRYYGAAYLLMFNRDIVTDMNLPDPQALTKEGKWTIDVMFDMMADAYVDLNGNGEVDQDDQIGFGYETLTAETLVLGCGYRYVENENGKMRATFDDENLVTLMQWMVQQYQQDGIILDGANGIDYGAMVEAGRVLFDSPCTFSMAAYRDFEYDFGMVPFPKENEMQDGYISYAQPWVVSVPYVPVTNTGDTLPMTGVLLDAMAAYGYEKVQPVIYEEVIMLKNTRDEASSEIVEMLYENVAIELASCIGLDGFTGKVQQMFTSNLGKTDITTLYAGSRESIENFFVNLEAQFKEIRTNLESAQ